MSVFRVFIGRFLLWNFFKLKVLPLNFRSRRFWIGQGVILTSAVILSIVGVRWFDKLDSSRDPDFLSQFRGGTLLIAGGGDLPSIVHQRFWELAGSRKGHLVIIPAYAATASDYQRLRSEWKQWRFASMQVLQANTRDDAENPSFADPIRNATSVWFSGGEQSWLANLYLDTDVEVRLQELLDRGGVIGGTSAGAAIMTRVMIEEGAREPKIRRGLDLLKDSVVDQHFFHRNRMHRLAKTLKQQSRLIGYGIDEGTALVVQIPKGRLGVLGKSYVMACIPDEESDSLRLEVLKPGDSIDIESLRPIERSIVDDYESI